MSDFPRAAARLSEGFCPLCYAYMTVSYCAKCAVGWNLTTVDGRPLIVPTGRELTGAECTRLYDRSEG